MIHQRHKTTRRRTADPFLRGRQDAVIYGFPKNPFRFDTADATQYTEGFNASISQLGPAYVSERIPADGRTKGNPLVWAGPQPKRAR